MTYNRAYSNGKECFIYEENINLCVKIMQSLAQNGMTSVELENFLGADANRAILVMKKLERACVIMQYTVTIQGQTMNFYQLSAD